jgi:outer membrane protein, multidrug efflux system
MNGTRIGPHALVLIATAALTACATTPLPKLATPDSAQWRHTVPVGPTPIDLHDWWKAFHDPQLDALVDRALLDNLNAAQAVERLHAARVLRIHADDRYRPQLSARAGDAIDYSTAASFLVVGFDASWELGLFGRAEATRRVMQGELDSASVGLEEVRVSLVGEVVADWLALGAAHEQAVQLAQIRDCRQHRLELLRIREQLGLATPGQLAEAETELAHSGTALLDVQQSIDANAQQLALLLGREEPEAAWLQSGRLAQLGEWSLRETPADLLRNRPEIRRAEAEVLRAAGEAGLARSERLPSVGIGGTLQWATDLDHTSVQHGSQIGAIGPDIDIPLFNWGVRLAQSKAKSFALQASVLAYREAVLEGVAETETALGNLQRQHERELLEEHALAAAQRSSLATSQRVDLKLASPMDQQIAAIDESDAQLELLRARAARGTAYVALFKALGGAPRPAADSETSALSP